MHLVSMVDLELLSKLVKIICFVVVSDKICIKVVLNFLSILQSKNLATFWILLLLVK